MNSLKVRLSMIVPAVLTCLALAVPAACAPYQQREGLPQSFKIGPLGDLTCVGMEEDACAYYDEIPTPSGMRYLVQGSSSRRPDPTRLHLGGAEYVTTYFALLCDRNGDTLDPAFNFLEGREKASDVHIQDLDADGYPEIIVTGIFDSRGSYAAAYRLTAQGEPERFFKRRANTPNSDFEIDHEGGASLIFEQRSKTDGGHRIEVFRWNGRTFAPES